MSRQLCIMACTFCRDPQFHAWMQSLNPADPGYPWGEAGAKAFILSLCGVITRAQLDIDPKARHRFHRLVREPFMAWKESLP